MKKHLLTLSVIFTTLFALAQDSSRQYCSMRNQYKQGNMDTLLLESLARSAFEYGDYELGDSVLTDLLPRIKNPFTKNRIDLMAASFNKPGSPAFKLFYHNAEIIDCFEKPQFAETMVRNAIIRQSPMILDLFNDHSPRQDWNIIYNDLEKKYGPDYAHRVIVWIKVPYYKNQRDWNLYTGSLLAYLKEYGGQVSLDDMNSYAWDIFHYCKNPEDLAFGLTFSERYLTIMEKPDPEFIDTYANLLYKSGKTAEAIAKETQALGLAEKGHKKTYLQTLERMKTGQKTWE